MEQQPKNVNMTAQLTNLPVGSSVSYSADRLSVVRVTASNLSLSLGRRYTTRTDRENRTVTVTRTE